MYFKTNRLGGNAVWLRGSSGTRYYYAHLSGYASGLSNGDRVDKGQLIGYMGATGNASVSHLHLGMGRIGEAVVRRARAFDMTIHYHNRRRVDPEIEQGATYHETVEGLMPHCDFLALHCVASPETAGLLDAEK